MHFLVDMNLSPSWVATLQAAGYGATHWSDVGPPNASDRELLCHAYEHGWIVFTHDLDFGSILAHAAADGPSVVQVREQDVDPLVIGKATVLAIEQCRRMLESGALVTIDLRRTKATALPLQRRSSR